MYRDLGDTGIADMANWCFRSWTICIPRYMGTSLALDDAAKCYLACKLAVADPTNTNLLAVRISNAKAVNSVRLALETKGSRPVRGNILLAVFLLYMVEVSYGNRSGDNYLDECGLTYILGLDVA